MDVRVVVSRSDPVGRTVLKLGLPVDLIVEEDVIDFKVETDSPLIVLSRHESSAKVPSLTIHTPGNPGDSAMGGRPRELAIAYPRLLRSIYLEMLKIPTEIDKTFEATHHGPTGLKVPVVFVEIGSDESYWTNESLVTALYKAVKNGVDSFDLTECNEVVSIFGGTHYSKTANRLVREGDCVAHVISKYYLQSMDDDVIRQAVTRSVNVVTKVLFDNVNRQIRERVTRALSDIPLKFESL